jgi:gamma-butyrobetaine dioxygenase/trimethyllysine dioxygenase
MERGPASDVAATAAWLDRPRVEVCPGHLRVHFHVGHADFHFRWLRHNCDQDRHPLTRERTLCSSELPDELGIDSAELAEDELRVRWSHDGRTSRYALGWLEEHAYARDRVEAPAPPSDLSAFVRQGDGAPLDRLVAEAIQGVRARGAAVIRRGASALRPEDETEPLVEAFAAQGLRLVTTHFGRIEDLRSDNVTNANTDQLGYTNAAVELHTDQPFLDEPPRYQVLQSIRKADAGGDNSLVDGLLAARYLESLDADAFQRLCSTPVPFHRRQKGFERVVRAPLLEMGPPFRIRFSYFTVAPYRLPFGEMEAWYRAHDRFARLVRNPRHQVRFSLEPGDFLLYDNHRMLHARTAFRGARWVRGMYFDP